MNCLTCVTRCVNSITTCYCEHLYSCVVIISLGFTTIILISVMFALICQDLCCTTVRKAAKYTRTYETLISEYGLSPAPSKKNYVLIYSLFLVLFALYALVLQQEVQESYEHPTTVNGVQQFSQLELPVGCFCSNGWISEYDCAYYNGSTIDWYVPCNITYYYNTSEHLYCYTLHCQEPVIANNRDSYIIIVVKYDSNSTLQGIYLQLSLFNLTKTCPYSESAIFVSKDFITNVLVTYSKHIYVNGTGQNAPETTAVTSISKIKLDDWYNLEIQIQMHSFNVLTYTDTPLMTWKQYFLSLIATIGTFYSISSVVSKYLAKYCDSFKIIVKQHGLYEVICES